MTNIQKLQIAYDFMKKYISIMDNADPMYTYDQLWIMVEDWNTFVDEELEPTVNKYVVWHKNNWDIYEYEIPDWEGGVVPFNLSNIDWKLTLMMESWGIEIPEFNHRADYFKWPEVYDD